MKKLLIILALLASASRAAEAQNFDYRAYQAVEGTLATDVTDTTATTVIAAQGANKSTYLTTACVTNNHGSTSTVVKVLNGATTKFRLNAAASGGGFCIDFSRAPIEGASNTTWRIQAETTGASLQAFYTGFVKP